jgi:putative oxidoreductase
MNFLQQINEWSKKHNPTWLVVIRVALGLCLFVKGFGFIKNNAVLEGFISTTGLVANASWLTTLIPWVHLLGGSMIIAGLFTRLGAVLQVPILIGAVFFVNAKKGIFAAESDFLFSIIILLLLLFFLIEGGGPLSLDNYFKRADRNETR